MAHSHAAHNIATLRQSLTTKPALDLDRGDAKERETGLLTPTNSHAAGTTANGCAAERATSFPSADRAQFRERR
jgi:hypothetical protein